MARVRTPVMHLLGFPVFVEPSWFFIVLLITWSLATGVFPTEVPNTPPLALWLMGAIGAVGLFACVLLHELAHATVARRADVRIKGITLWLFGGVAEMVDEPPNARTELAIAIAGPIMSALLGVLFFAGEALTGAVGMPAVAAVSGHLSYLNFTLAVFNLLPAFPLDGGRVLRALLWARNGDLKKSTRITARLGAGFGAAFIGLGVWMGLTGNLIGGLWIGLIGLFLRGAAKGSYESLVTRDWLADAPVSRFMSAQPITVPPSITLDELATEHLFRSHHRMYPVVEGGRLLGCVQSRDVAATPRTAWSSRTVSDVMHPLGPENTLDSHASAQDALRRMNEGEQRRFVVVNGPELAGMLSPRDLLDYLAVRAELEAGAPAPRRR